MFRRPCRRRGRSWGGVRNWPEVCEALVRGVRREAIGEATDERAQAILQEVLDYPGVPVSLRSLDATTPTLPVVPIQYARDDRQFEYFSTVTTLGTPQDITLQELRIECFFPANEATRAHARAGNTGTGSRGQVSGLSGELARPDACTRTS